MQLLVALFFHPYIPLHLSLSHILTDVYLSLNGTVIPNHGHLNISGIGSSDDSSLLCHTNRPATLGNSPKLHSGGDWFAPNGTRVSYNYVPGFTRNRGPMLVRLKDTSGDPQEGIFNCTIQDMENIYQMVYVGLYNAGGGKLNDNIECL